MKNLFPLAVKHHLEQIGLNKNEICILNSLFEHEFLTIFEIANETLLSNSTIRNSLSKLLKEGLIVKRMINDKRCFAFPSKERILGWITDRQENHYEKLEQTKTVINDFLKFLPENRYKTSKIDYYYGFTGIRQAHLKILNMKSKQMSSYIYSEQVRKYYPEYSTEFAPEAYKKNLYMRSIMHISQKDHKQICDKKNLEIRFLDSIWKIESRISMFDDSVLLMFLEQDLPMAIQIHEKNFYLFLMEKFEQDWQKAKKF